MDLSTDEPVTTDIAPATAPARASQAHGGDRLWKTLAGVAGVALIAFIVFVVTRPHHARTVTFPTSAAAALPQASQAPGFSLPRLGGGTPVSLSAALGTPTVVNFFASWCPDCKAELAAFAALARRTAGRVDVIGVDANDGTGAAAQTLLSEAQASYPVGVDSNATVATAYRLDALPVTYFLNGRGRVVHVAFGTQTPASLDRWTKQLTAAAVTPAGLSRRPDASGRRHRVRRPVAGLSETERAAAFSSGQRARSTGWPHSGPEASRCPVSSSCG